MSYNRKPSFRLASFNIRCPSDKGEHAWVNRAPLVTRVVIDNYFDICGMQEAAPIQTAFLDRELKGWKRIGVGREKDLTGEASCIYYKETRFECLAGDTFWLSETPAVPGSKSWHTACTRICSWGRFRDKRTDDVFFCFNTHLDHLSALARNKGMELILSRMAATAGDTPAILAGDMNAIKFDSHLSDADKQAIPPHHHPTPDGIDPIAMAAHVLYDACDVSLTPHYGPTQTFNAYLGPKLRIDYIFVSRQGIQVLNHITVADMPEGRFASDHYPVAVELVLEMSKGRS